MRGTREWFRARRCLHGCRSTLYRSWSRAHTCCWRSRYPRPRWRRRTDAYGVGLGDRPRSQRADLLQEPNGGVGAYHAFVHARPFAVQIVLGLIAGPRIQLETGGLRLVRGLGALVGIVTRNAAERPVAGRTPPVAVGGIVAIE